MNEKRYTPQYITVEFQNTRNNEEIIKASGEKWKKTLKAEEGTESGKQRTQERREGGLLPEQKEVPGGQSPGSSRKVEGSRRKGWD